VEQQLLRFLKDEFLDKGSGPVHMAAPATLHRDVMERFGLDLRRYREALAKLEHVGIVQYNPAAIEARNGFLRIDPAIIEVVRQFDNKVERAKHTERRPDRMDQAKRYFYGQWWFVVLVVAIGIVAGVATFISHIKTILQWF